MDQEGCLSPGFEAVAESVDVRRLRSVFAHFPSGLAALAAEVNGRPFGLVASSFSVGASFDPPMVMFSVQNSSVTWPVLRTAGTIGISILSDRHADAGLQLSSRTGDRFSGLRVTVAPSGSVFLDDVPLALDCLVHSETPIGDHSVVVLEVIAFRTNPHVEPLVYHGKAFRSLSRHERPR